MSLFIIAQHREVRLSSPVFNTYFSATDHAQRQEETAATLPFPPVFVHGPLQRNLRQITCTETS